MVVAGSESYPVIYFKCLKKVLVWMSPIYTPIYAPFSISSPQAAIPLYHNFLTDGDKMDGYLSNSLLLFPVNSIDTLSNSDLRVISFLVMRPSSSGHGVSVISLSAPAPFYFVFKVLSLLYMYILFQL